MVWRRKQGGLLQPDWLIRSINQDPEKIWNQQDFEKVVGYMLRMVKEKQLKTAVEAQAEADVHVFVCLFVLFFVPL